MTTFILSRNDYRAQQVKMLRSRMADLRQRHGDILNLWPMVAQQKFQQLRRELNKMETMTNES